jgi:molecular chaperone DnaJ
MNSVRHSGRGNMYVTVTVVVPKKLSSKQKKILTEFAEVSGDEIKHVEKGLFDRVKDAMK